MKLSKNDIRGIIGTVLFHVMILVCFIFFGFRTPLPLPAEEGVEVNLGNSDEGMGPVQPENLASFNANNANSGNPDQTYTQNSEETASLNENKNKNTTQQTEQKVNDKALYKGKQNSKGGSEGETGKPGDQGHPNGDPNAKNHYGTPGNNGISYFMKDRVYKSLPKPNYNSRDEGIVVVSIWVDKNGKVTKAIAGARGTTTTSQTLWRLAEDAARKSTFNEKADAPEEQKGTITYNFVNQN